jgi:hypothetical protein
MPGVEWCRAPEYEIKIEFITQENVPRKSSFGPLKNVRSNKSCLTAGF